MYYIVARLVIEQQKNLRLQENNHLLEMQNLQYDYLQDKIKEQDAISMMSDIISLLCPEYPLTYCSKGLLTPAVHHHDYWHHMK